MNMKLLKPHLPYTLLRTVHLSQCFVHHTLLYSKALKSTSTSICTPNHACFASVWKCCCLSMLPILYQSLSLRSRLHINKAITSRNSSTFDWQRWGCAERQQPSRGTGSKTRILQKDRFIIRAKSIRMRDVILRHVCVVCPPKSRGRWSAHEPPFFGPMGVYGAFATSTSTLHPTQVRQWQVVRSHLRNNSATTKVAASHPSS